MYKAFIKKLEKSLKQELPGEKAQYKMAPLFRDKFPESFDKAKLSSVLILLFPDNGKLNLILIKRPEYKGYHSGQISFPGGKFEKSDNNLINTALREAYEEIGINSEKIKIIGTISNLFIPVSNMMVLPVVGYTTETPELFPNKNEVETILKVKLDDLMNHLNQSFFNINFNAHNIKAPCYKVNGHNIWGATAMILSEFLEIISKVK
ncbi:MAG: CoA pyrophosphatase [Bacteroidales bacterium]|nr:CoA pyrophosphatase [Bacteroidales bacterium]